MKILYFDKNHQVITDLNNINNVNIVEQASPAAQTATQASLSPYKDVHGYVILCGHTVSYFFNITSAANALFNKSHLLTITHIDDLCNQHVGSLMGHSDQGRGDKHRGDSCRLHKMLMDNIFPVLMTAYEQNKQEHPEEFVPLYMAGIDYNKLKTSHTLAAPNYDSVGVALEYFFNPTNTNSYELVKTITQLHQDYLLNGNGDLSYLLSRFSETTLRSTTLHCAAIYLLNYFATNQNKNTIMTDIVLPKVIGYDKNTPSDNNSNVSVNDVVRFLLVLLNHYREQIGGLSSDLIDYVLHKIQDNPSFLSGASRTLFLKLIARTKTKLSEKQFETIVQMACIDADIFDGLFQYLIHSYESNAESKINLFDIYNTALSSCREHLTQNVDTEQAMQLRCQWQSICVAQQNKLILSIDRSDKLTVTQKRQLLSDEYILSIAAYNRLFTAVGGSYASVAGELASTLLNTLSNMGMLCQYHFDLFALQATSSLKLKLCLLNLVEKHNFDIFDTNTDKCLFIDKLLEPLPICVFKNTSSTEDTFSFVRDQLLVVSQAIELIADYDNGSFFTAKHIDIAVTKAAELIELNADYAIILLKRLFTAVITTANNQLYGYILQKILMNENLVEKIPQIDFRLKNY